METVCGLTFGDEHYVSTRSPDKLPPDNYSLVEVEYNADMVTSVRAEFKCGEQSDNLLLCDIPVMHYLKDIKDMKCSIEFQGVDEAPDDGVYCLFLLYICSYFSYYFFTTHKQPDLELLQSIFSYLELPSKNRLEEGWKKQVDYLNRHYGYLFSLPSNNLIHSGHSDEYDHLAPSADEITNDSKGEVLRTDEKRLEQELQKTLEKDLKQTLQRTLQQSLEKEAQKALQQTLEKIDQEVEKHLAKIDQEAKAIAKEMREFKRKLIADLRNHKQKEKH